MKKWAQIFAVIVAVALASPLMAGEGHKCTHSTQECLDYMAASLKERGWVGIEMDDKDGHMVVTKVIEDSPAEAAGFQTGDVLWAVNGVEMNDENQAKLKELQGQMKPGADFTYTVQRSGMNKKLNVTLGELPDAVLAQWVGQHMVNDHAEVKMASK